VRELSSVRPVRLEVVRSVAKAIVHGSVSGHGVVSIRQPVPGQRRRRLEELPVIWCQMSPADCEASADAAGSGANKADEGIVGESPMRLHRSEQEVER
jgi:hypothetical protein